MAFLIKQHDLEPNLSAQFFEPDGLTALDLTDAVSVSIVVRTKGPDGVFQFKSACTIDNPVQGLVSYQWAAGDTDTEGDYEYEFEIEWPTARPQTVPVDSYFVLTIVPDIG